MARTKDACVAPLHPQLAAIDAELQAATARARALTDGLDETTFHAGIDHVADAALAPHVIGFATVAEKRRAAA